MSVLGALFDDKVYSFEQAFGVKDVTSIEMREAIRAWFALYFGSDTPKAQDDCQRLPVVVVNKLTKTVFSEYSAHATGDGAKATFMQGVLDALYGVKESAMQQAMIGGQCFLKPVPYGKGFDIRVVRRDCMIPLAKDARGRVTSLGTAEQSEDGGKYYTLLERRTVGRDGRLTIESRLYRSDTRTSLGTQVPLASLDKYAEIAPEVTLPEPLYNLGMAELKTPLYNCVDGSSDGVSVYAPAVGLIRNINRNERQLCDEFENGASRIIASSDMVTTDSHGRKSIPDTMFVAVDDDPGNVGVTIFSPQLREASYLARKNEYLRNIESLIGLKRGILSEVEAAERTATEVTSSEGDYNLTIIDFQRAFESAARELLATCDILGRMYRLCGTEAFDAYTDAVFDWGDGVLYDRDKAWQEQLQMVQAGLLRPELALAWYYELPHDTPEDLAAIREKYMPELDALTGGA